MRFRGDEKLLLFWSAHPLRCHPRRLRNGDDLYYHHEHRHAHPARAKLDVRALVATGFSKSPWRPACRPKAKSTSTSANPWAGDGQTKSVETAIERKKNGLQILAARGRGAVCPRIVMMSGWRPRPERRTAGRFAQYLHARSCCRSAARQKLDCLKRSSASRRLNGRRAA